MGIAARLPQGVLGEKFGLDASLARPNTQSHEQLPPQLPEWPRNQPVRSDRPRDTGAKRLLVEPALIGAGSATSASSDGIHRPVAKVRKGPGGEPARPGHADLEVDQTGLALVIDQDIFTLVQIDVRDLAARASPGARLRAPGKTRR